MEKCSVFSEGEAECESKAVYLAIYFPFLFCVHELWVVTEELRLWIQAVEI